MHRAALSWSKACGCAVAVLCSAGAAGLGEPEAEAATGSEETSFCGGLSRHGGGPRNARPASLFRSSTLAKAPPHLSGEGVESSVYPSPLPATIMTRSCLLEGGGTVLYIFCVDAWTPVDIVMRCQVGSGCHGRKLVALVSSSPARHAGVTVDRLRGKWHAGPRHCDIVSTHSGQCMRVAADNRETGAAQWRRSVWGV